MPDDIRPESTIRSIRALLIGHGLDEEVVDAFLTRLQAEAAREVLDDAVKRSKLCWKILSDLLDRADAATRSDETQTKSKKILGAINMVVLGAAGGALWDGIKAIPDVVDTFRTNLTAPEPPSSSASPPTDNFEERWRGMSDVGPLNSPQFTPATLDLMADVLSRDYETLFMPIYEHTVALVGGRPIEAAEEMHNAIDYFSRAIEKATRVDGRPLQDAADSSGNGQVEDAFANLDAARRHLAIARFYCLEHQIVNLMERIRSLVARSSHDMREAESQLTRIARIEEDLYRIPRINAGPVFGRAQIKRDIRMLEHWIEELTNLTVKGYMILREILDKAHPSPT